MREWNLTDRESEIVMILADGRSNKEIARQLRITEGTVKVHMHHIFAKSGLTSRMVLIARVNRAGVE